MGEKDGYKITKVDMMLDKEWVDTAGHFDKKKWEKWDALSDKDKRKQNGHGCAAKFEQHITFNKADCEDLIQKGNSRIVLGRDRTSSIYSGYGGKAGSHCAMIDLVVGTHGHYARESNDAGELILADPAFHNDSARIYITQRCDIDDAFGLKLGRAGRPRNKSAVAIKADNIRIIAREGIKLITGTSDTNSQGGTIRGVTGIDLIADNDDSDMQPLVKGEELMTYLENIVMSIQELNGIVNHFWTLVERLETIAMTHSHVTTCGVGPGVAAPSYEMCALVPVNIAEEMTIQMPNQIINKINTAMQEIDRWIELISSGKRISLNPLALLLGDPMKGTLLSKSNYTN